MKSSKRQPARVARRPRTSGRKSIFVQVCLSPEQYDALLEQAQREQMSLGGWVRGAAEIVAAQSRTGMAA